MFVFLIMCLIRVLDCCSVLCLFDRVIGQLFELFAYVCVCLVTCLCLHIFVEVVVACECVC